MVITTHELGSLFTLRPPESAEEWELVHSIRQRAIFEPQLPHIAYDPENRPEDHATGHQVLCLLRNTVLVGTVRVDDLGEGRAAWRQLAIEPACHGLGYGRVLLALAERWAARRGYRRVVLHSPKAALMFYARNGYLHSEWDEISLDPANDVTLGKRLNLGLAQSPRHVLHAAAAR
ncbi:MAG: GNAT family N-acetyltransferase [Rhodobacterales bacterium]|nr:GNAT family N-acetyltransferase [Rhodobacterales bacterium]